MITSATGSTSFCLDRFSEGAGLDFRGRNNSRAKQKARNRVCHLLGIGSSAGHRWFAFGIMPNGLRLIKFRYLLEFVGCTLDETQNLTAEQRMLASHLALSVITPKHAAEVLKVSSDTLMNWATGRSPPNKDHARAIRRLLKPLTKEAKKKRRSWRRTLMSLNLISGPKTRSKEQPVATPALESTPPDALCDESDRVLVHVGAATGLDDRL